MGPQVLGSFPRVLLLYLPSGLPLLLWVFAASLQWCGGSGAEEVHGMSRKGGQYFISPAPEPLRISSLCVAAVILLLGFLFASEKLMPSC